MSKKPTNEDIEDAKEAETKAAAEANAKTDAAVTAAKEEPEAVTLTTTGEVKKDKEAK